MALKELLDKIIIERGGGTYKLEGAVLQPSYPVGVDKGGKPLRNAFTCTIESHLFPRALDWREGAVLPEEYAPVQAAVQEYLLELGGKKPDADGNVDAKGVTFDPAIHISNNDGTPKLAGGKYFCKKQVVDGN